MQRWERLVLAFAIALMVLWAVVVGYVVVEVIHWFYGLFGPLRAQPTTQTSTAWLPLTVLTVRSRAVNPGGHNGPGGPALPRGPGGPALPLAPFRPAGPAGPALPSVPS